MQSFIASCHVYKHIVVTINKTSIPYKNQCMQVKKCRKNSRHAFALQACSVHVLRAAFKLVASLT